MVYRLFFLLCVLSTGLLTAASAQSAESKVLLDRAARAYNQGAYRVAIEAYENLFEAGYHSGDLFYNLGNSYYRDGQIGRAVLWYERARQLRPGDADLRHNLSLLHQQLPQDLTPLPEFFLSRWWRNLRSLLSVNAWSVLALIFLWSGLGGMAVWLLGKSRPQRKWGFLVGLTLLLLSPLPFTLAAARQFPLAQSGYAVILEETTLYSAPENLSKMLKALPPGVKVELLDAIGDWRRLRLPNGEEGWVENKTMEEI